MEQFYLYDEHRRPIPIEDGFPKKYLATYGFRGALKCHAYQGKLPILFQAIKIGPYTIANCDYLILGTGKMGASSDQPCLELQFLLTGKVHIHLKGLGWTELEEGSHNIITLPAVKSAVYFKKTPVSTFDIHFTEPVFSTLALKYPRLVPVLAAYRENKCKSLRLKHNSTNPLIFHLIIQIKSALKAGLENEPSTLKLLEQLLVLALDNQPIISKISKFHYTYSNIEDIHQAHRLIGLYLDERDILVHKIKETKMKFAKFREGFKLLFGCLPSQYLQEMRLEKAHKLATEGRVTSIRDIAQLCGYGSSAHLSNKFFNRYGIHLSEILHPNSNSRN